MIIGTAETQRLDAHRLLVEGKVVDALALRRDVVARTADAPERDDWALSAKSMISPASRRRRRRSCDRASTSGPRPSTS